MEYLRGVRGAAPLQGRKTTAVHLSGRDPAVPPGCGP